jgi:hypothetical protein
MKKDAPLKTQRAEKTSDKKSTHKNIRGSKRPPMKKRHF